jgi:serine protease AprX
MWKRLIALGTVLLFLAPVASARVAPPDSLGPTADSPTAPGGPAATPVDPAPWWQRSALDLDGNGIHDSLDRLSVGDFPVVVVVDYAVAPGDGDIGALARLGLQVGVVLPTLKAASGLAHSQSEVRAAAALPETVMIEMAGRPYLDLDVANAALKARESKEYSPSTAWELGVTGKGINIAVMDTGVDNGHPGLVGKWLGGADISKPESRATPRDGSFDADDTQGHGTSVSGMALGTGAPDGTYAGLAPGASLVDLRIGTIFGAAPGEGPQNLYDATLQGIDWAIRFKEHAWGSGAPGIDILSLSWGNNVGGSSDGSDVYSRGIDKLVQAGIIAVIAAGNAGPSNDGFDGLGASSYAITVGATDDLNTIDRTDDAIASYSSRGPRKDNNDGYPFDELKPEVSAPGTDIISAEYDRVGDGSGNGYGPRGSGTSYATPMVSGIVALMLDANPDLKMNYKLVREILEHTAERRGEPTLPQLDPFWNKDYGWGIVDAYGAVRMAASLKGITDTVDPELQAFVLNSSALKGPVRDALDIQVVSYAKNGSVDSVEMQVDDGPWNRIASPGIGNQSTVAVAVDTRGLTDGNHTVRVRASSGGIHSLVDESTFAVRGASPRPTSLSPGGVLFLVGAIGVSAAAFFYIRQRVLRIRHLERPFPPENF